MSPESPQILHLDLPFAGACPRRGPSRDHSHPRRPARPVSPGLVHPPDRPRAAPAPDGPAPSTAHVECFGSPPKAARAHAAAEWTSAGIDGVPIDWSS